MQNSFTIFCLLQKAVMYAAQDFVFISPLTMDPGSNCCHGNYVKFKMVVMVKATCGGLMVIFFVIIVLYMSFIRIAGHCNACQWSYFKKGNGDIFWLVIEFVTFLLHIGILKRVKPVKVKLLCEQILVLLDSFSQISNKMFRGLIDTFG